MKKMKMVCCIAVCVLAAITSCTQRSEEQRYDPEEYFETAPADGGNSVQITNYIGLGQTVRIPPQIQKLPVTRIGAGAFREKNLTSVTIPDSVNAIGNSAFENNQLISVTIPGSVTQVGENVFQNNPLKELILYSVPDRAFAREDLTGISIIIGDGVANIGNEAFKDSKLTDITISGSVTNIGNEAFKNSQLTSIIIPNSVTRIGIMAFNQNQLTSIILPEKITQIEREVFADNKLTGITIPDSVTRIGELAFSRNQLTTVTIPNSVAHIGNEAFNNNPLTSVTISNSAVQIGNRAFGSYQLPAAITGQNRAVDAPRQNISENTAAAETSNQSTFRATHRVVTSDRSNLRLRDDQGTDANIIELLPYDTHVQVLRIGSSWVDNLNNHGNWTYILTSGGSRGWCFGAYLQPL